jgi:hypothetical protein
MGDGLKVVTSVLVEFRESRHNFIQWRALDRAGNGYTTSPHYEHWVDITPPVILEITPGQNEKQESPEVDIYTSIEDNYSGVAQNLSYRFGISGVNSIGEWTMIESQNDDSEFTFTVLFERGNTNVIQLRAEDLAGNSALSDFHTIWVNSRPVAVISFPVDGTLLMDIEELELNATNSSDPDGDPLDFEWLMDDVVLGSTMVSRHQLPVGTHSITLLVRDDMGAEDSTTVTVTVEEWVAPHTEEPNPNWVLPVLLFISVMMIVVVVTTIRMRKTREGPSPPNDV